MSHKTRFTELLNIEYPIIGGAMYPCSNPELVAAVSEAGGLGIVQPVSMVYVHGHEIRAGFKHLRSLTKKPIGMNILVEKSSKLYEDRMKAWVKVALEEGVRFFVTALGNPTWVIEMVRPEGGIVFHDVISRKWAERAVQYGVDGLICVNNRAGGHAGTEAPEVLLKDVKDFGLPLICAGGIGDRAGYEKALAMGYDGIQMGTRFIATKECRVHNEYKQAIVNAKETDIVLTDRVTGVPLSVIKTPYIESMGTQSSALTRWLLRHRRTKHWMRLFLTLRSGIQLKKSSQKGGSYKDYWQAGKSVAGVHSVKSVQEVFDEFVR